MDDSATRFSRFLGGRLTNSTRTIGGQHYPLQNMEYDDAGKLISETYPTNEVVSYSYNNADWLSAIGTSQGSTSLLNGAAYARAAGQYGGPATLMTSAALGGGAYQYSATYDALLRATDLKWTNSSGSTTYFDQTRTFDGVGNVVTANSSLPGGTDNQAFCYDEQDRLTWAQADNEAPPCTGVAGTPGTISSAQYRQGFGYDTLGRLASIGIPFGSTSGNRHYAYGDSAHPHALTSISQNIIGGQFTAYSAIYDAAGNMICRDPVGGNCSNGSAGGQLTYDAAGRLSAWQNAPTNPTASASFLYDAQGNRVEQQASQNGVTTTTIYVGNREEITTSGATTTTSTFYYAGSMRIALAVNGSFSYLAADGLGSANVAIKAADSSTSAILYAPYGGVRYSSGTMPTDYGFTGQHSDSVSGLDYYNARYYDPMAGQFASADSTLPGGGFDILGLSRYAYVEGNPESRTDPSGHQADPDEIATWTPVLIEGGAAAGGALAFIAGCAVSVVCGALVVGGVLTIGLVGYGIYLNANRPPQSGYWTTTCSFRCSGAAQQFHPQKPGQQPVKITPAPRLRFVGTNDAVDRLAAKRPYSVDLGGTGNPPKTPEKSWARLFIYIALFSGGGVLAFAGSSHQPEDWNPNNPDETGPSLKPSPQPSIEPTLEQPYWAPPSGESHSRPGPQ